MRYTNFLTFSLTVPYERVAYTAKYRTMVEKDDKHAFAAYPSLIDLLERKCR